jgi:hypothetical protein
MYYKSKVVDVSKVKQFEDKYFRFDYTKTKIDIVSGLRGYKEIIKDCR